MRAQNCFVLKCTDEMYEVQSQRDPERWYIVEKSEDYQDWACTCKDFLYRQEFTEGRCKHVLAVLEVERLALAC
jgi:hypothetical protein